MPNAQTSQSRQLVPAELAAILLQTIYTSSPQEDQVVNHLILSLEHRTDTIKTELVFLRAFAVDMAIATVLGNNQERHILLDSLYVQWALATGQGHGAALETWHDSLAYYRQLVSNAAPNTTGLGSQLGQAYAQRCQVPIDTATDLILFGASIFQALFTGIVELLEAANVHWSPADADADADAENLY